MIEPIIRGISRKLKKLVPDIKRIYSDDTEQHIEKPCFIIEATPIDISDRLGDIQTFEYRFAVTLLCHQENINTLRNLMERLAFHLRFIEIRNERPVIALNRNVVVVDRDHAAITFTIKQSLKADLEPFPTMQKMESNFKVYGKEN